MCKSNWILAKIVLSAGGSLPAVFSTLGCPPAVFLEGSASNRLSSSQAGWLEGSTSGGNALNPQIYQSFSKSKALLWLVLRRKWNLFRKDILLFCPSISPSTGSGLPTGLAQDTIPLAFEMLSTLPKISSLTLFRPAISKQSESNGGADRDRTDGLIRARDALSQTELLPQ